MKLWLKVATAVACGALIAACSSSSTTTTTTTGATGTTTTGAGGSTTTTTASHPVGGTFTIGVATNPPNLIQDFTDNQDTDTMSPLWGDSLITLNGAEVPQADLATSWAVSNGGKTDTFQLRHGVLWQDGKPFTSADVVYTLGVLKYSPLVAASLPSDIASVTANGPYTVVIHLKAPYAALLVQLAGTETILPAHIYQGHGNPLTNPANSHPIGTGPYMFQSWTQNQQIVFVRNPHYWDAPEPYFDKVVVAVIPNQTTEINAMLAGEIDFLPDSELPTTNIAQIKASSCCRAVLVHDTPSLALLFPNTARAPLNNLKVRQAVYMAINKNYIVSAGFQGFAQAAVGPIPSTYSQLYDPAVNLLTQYPYDPTKAAAMLTAAGYPVKNGSRFTLTYAYSDSIAGGSSVAAIVKAELAQVQINVNLVDEDLNTWAARTYTARNFDLSYMTYTSSNDPSAGIARVYLCQSNRTLLYTNPTGYCNPQLDALWNAAAVASTVSARAADFAKATQIIASDLPAYTLAFRTADVAISKKVQNWQQALSSGGSFAADWADAWFAG